MLKLDDISTNVKTNYRDIVDAKVVEYAKLMEEGYVFPPIRVVEDKKLLTYYLVDGFHRTAAARKAGLSELEAIKIEGDARDAIWYALGANTEHGIPLESGEKRRRIEAILENEAFKDKSVADIAKLLNCSRWYVHKTKKEIDGKVETDISSVNDSPISIVDELGQEVPADLEEAFNIRGKVNQIKNRIEEVSKLIDDLVDEPGSERINWLEATKSLNWIKKAISDVPHRVCQCGGVNEKCLNCDGLGYLTKEQCKTLAN